MVLNLITCHIALSRAYGQASNLIWILFPARRTRDATRRYSGWKALGFSEIAINFLSWICNAESITTLLPSLVKLCWSSNSIDVVLFHRHDCSAKLSDHLARDMQGDRISSWCLYAPRGFFDAFQQRFIYVSRALLLSPRCRASLRW